MHFSSSWKSVKFDSPGMRGGGLLITFLFFTFIILVVVIGVRSSSDKPDPEPDVLNGSEDSPINSPVPATRKHDTAIVAAPDGKIHLVDIGSGKVLWSFSSGPSIYSSDQTFRNDEGDDLDSSADGDNFYIDVGEDWKLYLHGNGNKMKLSLSPEDIVRRTPFVMTGGGVMLGSKRTAVFLVDAETGKVVRTFKSDNFPSVVEHGDESSTQASKDLEEWVASRTTDLEDVEKPLYVTRTDYALKYTSKKTGKVLWYVMFADFDASFQCEGIDSFVDELLPEVEKYYGLGHKLDTTLPVHCQARPVIYRIHDRTSLESLSVVDKLQGALPGGGLLSLPASDQYTVLEHMDKFLALHHDNGREMMLALPESNPGKFTTRAMPRGGGHQMNSSIDSHNSGRTYYWPLFRVFKSLAVVFVVFLVLAMVWKRAKANLQPQDNRFQVVATKKKKSRRSPANRNGTIVDKNINSVSDHENVKGKDLHSIETTRGNFSPKFSYNPDGFVDGRLIGKLLVSNKEIAKGSNGTIVLEGIYDGRLVAVKRLVQAHHEVAFKEIQNLIASDQHPNIVRWYGVEYDQDFIYLALERCTCNLHDFIYSYSPSSKNQITIADQDNGSLSDCTVRLKLDVRNNKDLQPWKANGYPSACLLKLMRDIVSGLAHLHELGIIHRDLKPQNVLVIKERSISAKLSDMGISKRLSGDTSSLTNHATGYGSSGWQAPEQLRHERHTRALDLFSLGCVLFFCMTEGNHPFGENFQRDMNIINNQKDLFLIEHLPEATDLISQLLDPNPHLRPTPKEVMQHPMFWNSETRLSFLRDASDRVELEDRETDSEVLKALESVGTVALGCKWDEKMDAAFINDIGRYRRYKFDSVRDLLRVIRNKLNHYRELPKEIQGILGPVPEGFDSYFSSRFPRLLIEVYKVIRRFCVGEETFQKYFVSD